MKKGQRFQRYLRNARAKNTPYEPTYQAAVLAYNYINEAVFNNMLVRPPIIIRRLNKAWGQCWWVKDDDPKVDFTPHCTKIELTSSFLSKEQFIEVLAHEMVHQYQADFLHRMDHGKTFKEWAPFIKEKFGLRI